MDGDVKIVSVDKALRPGCVGVLVQAFADDPLLLRILEGLSPAEREKRLQVLFSASLRQQNGASLCATGGSGQVLGCAILHLPGSYPPPLPAQLALIARVILGAGTHGLGRWLRWDRAASRQHVSGPHLYLDFIGVDPARQNNGAGSALLLHVIRLAQERGVGIYLESTNPRNLSLYQRHGFQTLHRCEVMSTPAWFLWRSRSYGLGLT